MVVSGKSLEEIEDIWLGLETSDVFRLRYDPERLPSLTPVLPLQFTFQSARLVGGFVAETTRFGGNGWETIQPAPDFGGIGGFLRFGSQRAKDLISAVRREATEILAPPFRGGNARSRRGARDGNADALVEAKEYP